MKKLTKTGIIKQIDTIIHKDYLKEISDLSMTNWKAYRYIAEIGSYRTKYYSKMKVEEIFFMLIELKKCLNIELSLEDIYYKNQYEKIVA